MFLSDGSIVVLFELSQLSITVNKLIQNRSTSFDQRYRNSAHFEPYKDFKTKCQSSWVDYWEFLRDVLPEYATTFITETKTLKSIPTEGRKVGGSADIPSKPGVAC